MPLSLDPTRAQFETLVGRSLALCVHPYATWRSRSTRRRVFVLLAYVAGSYSVVLAILYASK